MINWYNIGSIVVSEKSGNILVILLGNQNCNEDIYRKANTKYRDTKYNLGEVRQILK